MSANPDGMVNTIQALTASSWLPSLQYAPGKTTLVWGVWFSRVVDKATTSCDITLRSNLDFQDTQNGNKAKKIKAAQGTNI